MGDVLVCPYVHIKIGNIFEQSIADTDYDWLRVTMVSHDVNDITFGSGNGNETQLIKLYFKIDDVNDNFSAKSFRIPTFYNGNQGYYTYVSDDYLLDYKVYIDVKRNINDKNK